MKDLRELVNQEPDKFKTRVQEWLAEGKTLKALAEHLEVPYATLHRVCKDLNIYAGRSVLSSIPIEDWAMKSKKMIADENLVSYQHVYNYYHYHRQRLEDEIREFKGRTAGPGDNGIVDGSDRTDLGGPRKVSRGSLQEVSESGSPAVAGDETGSVRPRRFCS